MMMAARERCERGKSDRIYDVIGVFWPDKRAELKIITIVCVCGGGRGVSFCYIFILSQVAAMHCKNL